MTATVLYDGVIDSAAIAAAIGTHSGANIVATDYANGMRYLVIKTDQ